MIVHNVPQGEDEWHALRAGIPTASEGSKLVTSKGVVSKSLPDYAIELAADLYAGEPVDKWEGNKWTQRGHELEDSGRAWYENTYPKAIVTQVGFVLNDEGTAGCSPDSLVNEQGMLEIKALGKKAHIQTMRYVEAHGHQPSTYIVQPQFQMLVCKRDWNDLLFFHPQLPSFVVHILPDLKIQAMLAVQIDAVRAERDIITKLLERHA